MSNIFDLFWNFINMLENKYQIIIVENNFKYSL